MFFFLKARRMEKLNVRASFIFFHHVQRLTYYQILR